MSSVVSARPENRLLAALPPASLESLLPKLTPVPLDLRHVLYQPNGAIESVYFVNSGLVSMVTHLDDGMQAEVGIIGREGLVGLPVMFGAKTSFVESMVQMTGDALRMNTRDFLQEIETNEPLRSLLYKYGDAIYSQVMQTAACNGRHGLEQRLARWLLMAHDRTDGDHLFLTQEFIAMMLGVHRPSITVTAGILQRAGLIGYVPGRITVLDRASLEAASCECHQAVKRRYEELLGTDGS